jgi:hypothetical protein
MTEEEKLEAQWGRALVHESGHALMAVQQKVPCDGVYYNKTYRKLCNVAYLPPVSGYSTEHFLFHSAGSAAELLIYDDCDDEAAKSDKLPFENDGAPDFQKIVNKSRAILSTQRELLDSLISQLKSKCLQIGLDFEALPETQIENIDGILGVLLSKQELEDTVCSK